MKHMMSVIGLAVLLVLTPILSAGAAAATDGGTHGGSGYAGRGSAPTSDGPSAPHRIPGGGFPPDRPGE